MAFNATDSDYYRVLGIDRTANSHDIHRAFRQKSRLYHPDKGSGNEELMKLLTQCKQTLLDPDMKAQYDDRYEPGRNGNNNRDNDTDNIHDNLTTLNCGERLSDNYLRKLDEWTEEFAGISLVDNRDFIGQQWLELRDKLRANKPSGDSVTLEHSIGQREIYDNFIAKCYETANDMKTFIPANLRPLNQPRAIDKLRFYWYHIQDVHESDSFKWRQVAEWYFEHGDYENALMCYKETGSNEREIIIEKLKLLYSKHKYDDCLLYIRYALHLGYIWLSNSEITRIMLVVAWKLGLNWRRLDLTDEQGDDNGGHKNRTLYKADALFKPIVCAAYHYRDEPEIQHLMFELLVARELYMEARALLAANEPHCQKIASEKFRHYLTIRSMYDRSHCDKLRALVSAYQFLNSARYMLTHHCVPAIKTVYTELTAKSVTGLGEQVETKEVAMLLVMRGAYLLYEHDYHNSYESLRDALYVYPVEDCMDAVVALMGPGHDPLAIESLLSFIKLENLEAPTPGVNQYAHMLNSNIILRTLVKYEHGIHSNRYGDNKTLVDKAMMYVDLTMAVPAPIFHANNFTMASYYLLQHMLTWVPNDDQADTYLARMFAYRNCICTLSDKVLQVACRYLDPISVVNYSALCFNIINRAHLTLAKQIKLAGPSVGTSNSIQLTERLLIDESHQVLFGMINCLLKKSIKLCPMINIQLHNSSDILFVDMVNTGFLERYYTYFVDNSLRSAANPLSPVYQYYLLEGSWKNWYFSDKFLLYREQCMRTLLRQKGLDIERVETMMRWPVIRRDRSGWLNLRNRTLNLPGQTFTGVEGVMIDTERGTFEVLLARDSGRPALINTTDIDEVLTRGVTQAWFSLDPVSDTWDYDYHPFQRLKYSPQSINGTNYLATLLHADYLLKMFTMGTEVSAHQPFPMRDGYNNGLLSVLPDELREDLRLNPEGSVGQTHRFWIQALELDYEDTIDHDNKRKMIRFGECQMEVREHPMTRLVDGRLVDDTDPDSERREASPEARFAKLFTECYDEIGEYFPIFSRLRELLKLQAVATIVGATCRHLDDMKRAIRVDRERINELLSSIRPKIQYPINTVAKVNEIFYKNCRAAQQEMPQFDRGNLTDYEVSLIKSKIASNLASQEEQQFDAVAVALAEVLQLKRTQETRRLIGRWIRSGEERQLIDHLQKQIELREMAELDRFSQACRQKCMVFDADPGDYNVTGINDWIPAAYGISSRHRVYGGVSLVTQLKNVTASGSGQSAGGGGSRGAGGQGSSGGSGGDDGNGGKGGKGPFVPHTTIVTKQGVHVKTGPSGRPMIHKPQYSTRKAAQEAAKRASNSHEHRVLNHNDPGKQRQLTGQKLKDYHNKNHKSDHNPHFHAVDAKGNKLHDGVHHLHPK